MVTLETKAWRTVSFPMLRQLTARQAVDGVVSLRVENPKN